MSDQKYKEVILTQCKKRPFLSGSPFSIAFTYSCTGPIVIKGSGEDVRKYISSTLSLCHYRILTYSRLNLRMRTFLKHNPDHKLKNISPDRKHQIISRWEINDPEWRIKKEKIGAKSRYVFSYRGKVVFSMRRVPNKYIEQFTHSDAAKIIMNLASEDTKK